MVSYFTEIWSCRHFWLALVKNDLRARYRRSALGLGWSLLRPLLMTSILSLVLGQIFGRTDVWTFAIYLLSGLCCWDYIVGSAKQGCDCFFHGETFLRQHPTPLAVFPLRVALAETFQFFMTLSVLLGLVWCAQGFHNLPVLISLLPTFLLLFVLTWSVSLLSGFANVYVKDTQHVFDVVFQALFYLTPIVYHTSDLGNGRLSWVVGNCNPLVPLLRLFREPILEARVPSLETYVSALLVVVVVAGLASLAGRRAQRQLIFHL